MRADDVPPPRQLPYLGPPDEPRSPEVVRSNEEVTAPPCTLEQVGDASIRAGAAVVECQKDRRRAHDTCEQIVYRASPRGDGGCGLQVPLEVVAVKLELVKLIVSVSATW